MDAISISLSGLDVEWQRLQLAAQNLANMNSTRTATGDVYRPLRLVSGPESDFSTMLNGGTAQLTPVRVRVMGVEPLTDGVRRSYEPSHPHADPQGLVTYPNIDHAGEMTTMIRASRVYEANLAAITMARDMYARALELGGQS